MLAGYSLIRQQRLNPKQLGQVWTNHSNLIQLWTLITIRYLTHDKNFTRIEVITFWPLFLNWSKNPKINSNLPLGEWHLVVQFPFPFTEILIQKPEKILVSGPFVPPYSYLAQVTTSKVNQVFLFWYDALLNYFIDPFTFTQIIVWTYGKCLFQAPIMAPNLKKKGSSRNPKIQS